MRYQKRTEEYLTDPGRTEEDSELNNLRIVLEAGYWELFDWMHINPTIYAGELKYFQLLETAYPEYGYLCSYRIERAMDCLYQEYMHVCDLYDLECEGFGTGEMPEYEEIEGQISMDEYIAVIFPMFRPSGLIELLAVHA